MPLGVPDRRRDLGFLARSQTWMGEQHPAQIEERDNCHHERRVRRDESHGRLHHRFNSALAARAERHR